MQMGFYFDQTRCSGCFTCIVACKDANNVEAGAASWMRVKTIEKGKFPDLLVSFLFSPCYHCEDPACASVCPAEAISKRDSDGIVMVDRDECLGRDSCGQCLDACPYGAPQFEDEDDAKMEKCNFCQDRLAEGKKPICVDACIMRAMDAGPLDELQEKYGHEKNAEGFIYSEELKPAVVFKPKPDQKGRPVRRTDTCPVYYETSEKVLSR